MPLLILRKYALRIIIWSLEFLGIAFISGLALQQWGGDYLDFARTQFQTLLDLEIGPVSIGQWLVMAGVHQALTIVAAGYAAKFTIMAARTTLSFKGLSS